MQRSTQSKTKRETCSHQQRHVLIPRNADTRGAEGSKHLWAGDGTAIIIISFLLVSPFRLPPPPPPPPPPCPHSPTSGWEYMAEWMAQFPATTKAEKTRFFLPGLVYALLCQSSGPIGPVWGQHLASRSETCHPSHSSCRPSLALSCSLPLTLNLLENLIIGHAKQWPQEIRRCGPFGLEKMRRCLLKKVVWVIIEHGPTALRQCWLLDICKCLSLSI